MKRNMKCLCCLLICLLTAFPLHIFAAEPISNTEDLTLTLTYFDGKTPLKGAKFSIYLVAEADELGALTVTEDFDRFGVDIAGAEGEKWYTLAQTLESYALRYNLKPADSGKIDRKGTLTFPTGKNTLTPGLYLVVGDRHLQDGMIYDAVPFLVMLPTLDVDSDSWNYQVTASPKHDSRPRPEEPGEETITRKVLKIWNDDGDNALHPEITVQLLRDNEVYDTVVLSAFNNWSYTWNNLDSNYRWRVVELVPEGYTVEITREGITFVIVNTPEEPDEPGNPDNPDYPDYPDKPDKPDNPDNPDNPDKPDNPGSPENPDHPKNPGSSENPGTPSNPSRPGTPSQTLPVTGQLWWPVPALLCAGLALVILGLLRRKGAGDEA